MASNGGAASQSLAKLESGTPKVRRSGVPGDVGTHWAAPNEYLLAQATRVNFVTAKRIPFKANADTLAVQLQRLVHHEGNRPPNRKILLHLRLLTFYPPVEDIVPELITLLESENVHVCRLVHYHLRQGAHLLRSGEHHRDIFEALERESARPSPARRAAATKTLTKIIRITDVARATDFVSNVFNTIGGARVEDPNKTVRRKVVGVDIPGTDLSKKKSKGIGINGMLMSPKVVKAEATTQEEADKRDKRHQDDGLDDGAGGTIETFTSVAAEVKSKKGKMLVGHAVFAGLRRINRVSKDHAKVEAFFFDSGFLSVVPSTVRHCMALLEIRSTVSPGPVSRYLAQRLPHKNPPANKRLHLQDLGGRVYFARLLGALAEDPDLSAYIPERASSNLSPQRTGEGPTIKEALGQPTLKKKAAGLFQFLFNKDRVDDVRTAVQTTKNVVNTTLVPKMRRKDPLGVDFAEALVNLLKNASNRVLIQALRGLAHRKWTTWFEAPLPQAALYNSPELNETTGYDSVYVEDEDDEGRDDEDEDELGAYDNDLGNDERETSNATSPKRNSEVDHQQRVGSPDKDLTGEEAAENATWFSRLRSNRKQRREQRIEGDAPFYLRKLGHGVVPALEVVLRRIYAAMLHDEPIRRFAAADAIMALARAKIYGHVEEDHKKLRQAQTAYRGYASSSAPSTRRDVALVPGSQTGTAGTNALTVGASFEGEEHPFEALIRPLTELLSEDSSQYVRSRAAVGLAFVLGSGAGRRERENKQTNFDSEDDVSNGNEAGIMVDYFGAYVQNPEAGRGVGLRLVAEFVDYILYEILDASPDLAPSSIRLVELWANTHATIGVCGRLGAIWEKVLSMGLGSIVGDSIFRAFQSPPERERVASAAAVFLRRRTLDLAVLTAGASHLAGFAVPEPLPRAIGMEMEKYFSLLWHCALLGPSAECRVFAVEALGGAAALAGDPFRICVYERLVELVRVRGLGLKATAEVVLSCIDMLYSVRERFSEARAAGNIARDGSSTSRRWLQAVWQLAAQSSSAAQILLGAPPPPGWQPLGPAAAMDVTNAERAFGPVRDRTVEGSPKDSIVPQITSAEGVQEDQTGKARDRRVDNSQADDSSFGEVRERRGDCDEEYDSWDGRR